MKENLSEITNLLKEADKILFIFETVTNKNKKLKYYDELEAKLLICIKKDATALIAYDRLIRLNLMMAEKILYNNGVYLKNTNPDIIKEAEPYLSKLTEAFKKAEPLINQYKKDHPYHAIDYLLYGFYAKALFHLSKNDEAIKYYEKAIQKNPDHLFSTNMIAVLLMEEKRYNEAEQYLYKILKKDRYNYLALSNLGEIAKEKNEFKKAKVYYEAALEVNSEDSFSQKELEKIKYKVPKPHIYNLELIREKAFTYNYTTNIFSEYIDNDGIFIDKEIKIYFEVKIIGDIHINSGKIMTCDMSFMDEDYIFTKTFPKGDFPVELAIAKFKEDKDERTAFVQIKFSENKPVKWEHGQFKKKYTTYGIDSGKACLMDVSYKEKYLSILENIKLHGKLIDDADKNYKDTRSWMMLNKKDLNVALFSTGYGDGAYQSYIGYDKDNKICRLVTDFQIITNEDES